MESKVQQTRLEVVQLAQCASNFCAFFSFVLIQRGSRGIGYICIPGKNYKKAVLSQRWPCDARYI